ncbi:MAG TPA: hypothetical protein VM366_08230 [Anaerolineae bacterium]|nr:hypothetical protein [Anaerolineae bacterium]
MPRLGVYCPAVLLFPFCKDEEEAREARFSLPLTALGPGDNPIYVKLAQEDGHMAWSSPIYVVCAER